MEISSAGYQKNSQAIMPPLGRTREMPMSMLYFLFFLLVAITAASFLILGIKLHLPAPAARISYFIFMLAAGISHWLLLPKCLPEIYQPGIKWQFLYSLLLAIAILFVSLFLFTLIRFAMPLNCLPGAGIFLLPSAIHLSREYLEETFAVVKYDPWLLPPSAPERKASLFLKSLPLYLQVKVKCYDLEEKKFNITMPAHLKLGEMFHRFLVDNETRPVSIQLFDIDEEAFAWKFTLKKKTGNKLLDPGASLINNCIRKNNTIIAERVATTLPK